MSSIAVFFAQVTNAASAAVADSPDAPAKASPTWIPWVYFALLFVMVYFAFIRPQTQAKKKQEETVKAAKTGDRVVTTSGIHGVISNVKETTVIVKVADNVKLEIEKSHIDKITRDSAPTDADKGVAVKVS